MVTCWTIQLFQISWPELKRLHLRRGRGKVFPASPMMKPISYTARRRSPAGTGKSGPRRTSRKPSRRERSSKIRKLESMWVAPSCKEQNMPKRRSKGKVTKRNEFTLCQNISMNLYVICISCCNGMLMLSWRALHWHGKLYNYVHRKLIHCE